MEELGNVVTVLVLIASGGTFFGLILGYFTEGTEEDGTKYDERYLILAILLLLSLMAIGGLVWYNHPSQVPSVNIGCSSHWENVPEGPVFGIKPAAETECACTFPEHPYMFISCPCTQDGSHK